MFRRGVACLSLLRAGRMSRERLLTAIIAKDRTVGVHDIAMTIDDGFCDLSHLGCLRTEALNGPNAAGAQ